MSHRILADTLQTVQIGPLVEQASSELRAIVDPNGLRRSPFDDKTVEDLNDIEGSEGHCQDNLAVAADRP